MYITFILIPFTCLFLVLPFTRCTSLSKKTASRTSSQTDMTLELPSTTRYWSLREGSCSGGAEYMCLDWSFGSTRLVEAASKFRPNIYFGVGSYGRAENIGKCYEITLDTTWKKFITQVINEGSDVNHGQFDMQMASGGFGMHNACTARGRNGRTESGSWPMFNQHAAVFGKRYGGHWQMKGCSWVPMSPFNGYRPWWEPSMRELCERSWKWGARRPGNPNIKHIKRVRCPKQLCEITGLRLKSDDRWFHNEEHWNYGIMTSMFDCCKPSGAWPKRANGSFKYFADPRYPNVRACTRDGYTRVSKENRKYY